MDGKRVPAASVDVAEDVELVHAPMLQAVEHLAGERERERKRKRERERERELIIKAFDR